MKCGLCKLPLTSKKDLVLCAAFSLLANGFPSFIIYHRKCYNDVKSKSTIAPGIIELDKLENFKKRGYFATAIALSLPILIPKIFYGVNYDTWFDAFAITGILYVICIPIVYYTTIPIRLANSINKLKN